VAGAFLLDTNVASLLVGRDQATAQRVVLASSVSLPSVVLGELYFGVYKIRNTRRGRQLRIDYDAIAARFPVLACDRGTADFYARVRGELELKGQRIPENDMWIAALALQHALTVATRDGHFQRVTGLAMEMW
jgi:tRNA(fMet)-specific endonuclease VapC